MVCVSSVSNAQVETSKTYSFNLSHLKNTNDASIIFWHWLLDYTKLTPQHASLHNIYQCDTSAFFFDLNNDGTNEILGTHYSTSITGEGNCLLYILKYDKSKPKNYQKISDNLYFDAHSPIVIIQNNKNNFAQIQATDINQNIKYFVFNKRKNYYHLKK